MQKPVIVCLDLEGVLVPEIWINVALKTGIEELKITTREMPDYNALMKRRLAILDEHKLTIHDIQQVIDKMGPLEEPSTLSPGFASAARSSFYPTPSISSPIP